MKKIELSRGLFALVDDEDFEELSKFNWSARFSGKRFYAGTSTGKKHIFMHRFILKPKEDNHVDHIDGDGLDNRKSNLRICKQIQNTWNTKLRVANTSGYTGVSWNKQRNKWMCQITNNRKRKTLGHFTDPVEAAKVYDRAAREYRGSYARLNFPEEP